MYRKIASRLVVEQLKVRLGVTARAAAAALVIMAGCSKAPSVGTVSIEYLNWKAAKPIKELSGSNTSVVPVLKLTNARSSDPIYFAEMTPDSADGGLRHPLIVRKTAGRWTALDADNDWSGNGWQFAATGPHPREIWAVLDHVEEDPGWDLVLMHSTDDGGTWVARPLQKPVYFATFAGFAMTGDGHGTITLKLSEDYTRSIKAGNYKYVTSDGGATWSEPALEPNQLKPAAAAGTDGTRSAFAQ